MPIERHTIELCGDRALELVTQRTQPDGFLRHHLAGDFARLAETDDSRDVQRAGAKATLLATALDHGRQPYTRVLRAHVKRPRSLRPVNLVRRKRKQVDAHRIDVDRNLADRL